MPNIERDKFLTEALGLCWHKYKGYGYYCLKCQNYKLGQGQDYDFSDWSGFGILWEWAQKQEWWVDFLHDELHPYWEDQVKRLVDPTYFASAVYSFLRK